MTNHNKTLTNQYINVVLDTIDFGNINRPNIVNHKDDVLGLILTGWCVHVGGHSIRIDNIRSNVPYIGHDSVLQFNITYFLYDSNGDKFRTINAQGSLYQCHQYAISFL